MLYHTEMFAHFVYSPDLSYHELMDAEDELKPFFLELLEGQEANYVNFEAVGDTLRVQCVFKSFDETLFHSICEGLKPIIDENLDGRILFVDKGLGALAFYLLDQDGWKESILSLPQTAIYTRLKEEALDT